MQARYVYCTAFVVAVLGWTATSPGVLIRPHYSIFEFPGQQPEVILEAVKEWADWLPCNDGFTLDINFTCDTSLNQGTDPMLGVTRNWTFNSVGRPISADIAIDNDDHHWTMNAPMVNAYDAAQTLKHEIAHALGFTVNSPAFRSHVWPPAGTPGDRFYDFNGDHQLNGPDFDLIDNPAFGTHAVDGSGDLMERVLRMGQRRTPSFADASALVDAFGYCPEPGGALLLLGAVMGLRRSRR